MRSHMVGFHVGPLPRSLLLMIDCADYHFPIEQEKVSGVGWCTDSRLTTRCLSLDTLPLWRCQVPRLPQLDLPAPSYAFSLYLFLSLPLFSTFFSLLFFFINVFVCYSLTLSLFSAALLVLVNFIDLPWGSMQCV
jgi:hypothetical protein